MELEHAKRNLINYITSVKQLENAIEQQPQMGAQYALIEKFKSEIYRLNEEN